MKKSTAIIILTATLFFCGICQGAKISGADRTLVTSRPISTAIKRGEPAPAAVKKIDKPKELKKAASRIDAGTSNEARYVTIDFNDVDIRVFIKFISELTGKNFVVDSKVKGKVTIISPNKISSKEAYRVFESVLETHGYTTVPAGDITKIVPSQAARGKNIETRLKMEAISPEDRVITQIITLNFANPDELKKVLTPLISKSSVMLSYSPTGMLVVTDLLSNIKRLLKIINALDIEGIEEQISVIPLKYSASATIAKSLNQIFQKTSGKKNAKTLTQIRIVADERTNTIITLASENDTFRIRELITLLDREVPRGEEKVRVYRLQNADAEELTKVLMDIPKNDSKVKEKGKTPLLSRDIKIVPDKATNTLVITAEKDDYKVLEDVIRQLDIPRPMVYIEALIMEVNVDNEFKIGAEWMGGEYINPSSGRAKAYGGGFLGGNILGGTGNPLPEGFSVGVFGEAISIGGITFPSLGAVFQAYQQNEDVHILSTPQIMTLDNEEAEIYVGENVPYQTRSETSSASIDYSSYEYKDVGVTLKITPQISQERFVRLNIFQEITKLKPQATQTDRPTTFKRTTKTTVSIKDMNTIVIGGLIGEDITNTEYRVPCIANIPLLGWLFKYQSENREKRNLFIFITPHIIENPVEAKVLYEEKQGKIDTVKEGVIKKYHNSRLLNNKK